MPTYEYECGSCRHRFERQQKMSAPPVKKCPECGNAVRRLIAPVAGFVRGTSTPCSTRPAPCSKTRECDRRSCELLER